MMTNFFKRTISILLGLTLVFQFSIVSAFANTSDNGVSEIDNNFVLLRTKNENGRFTIRTKEGNPTRETDNDEKLLFEEFEPQTSFTTFRINGEDFIYGNDYGFLGLGGYFINPPQVSVDGLSNSSIWRVGDVEIIQYLELVDDPENENAGNVKIRYEATNKGSSSVEIGSRILLDTMIGSNDGAPVVLGTDINPVIMEREITGDEIPLYYRSMDDYYAPKVMAYGFLEGWGNIRPDRMIVGHYEGLSTTKWDYTVNPSLNFTDKNNEFGVADSSIALYWNPTAIEPNETIVFETYYGVGNVQATLQEANFGVNLISPEKLTVNSERTDYTDGSFDIVVELDNSLEGIEALNDVQVSLILGDGLETDVDEIPYRHFDSINAKEMKTMTFRVKALPQNSYKLLKYRIDVTTAAIDAPISFNKYILAPGLKGSPPEIQYQSLSSSYVYYKGEKVFSINGTGFDFYSDKTKWNMYLESSVTEQRIQVNRDNITVSGNDKITVSYSEDLELGEYKIVIESSVLGTETVLPHTITSSDNKKHEAKSYGLMAIVKTVDVDDKVAKKFTYSVDMLEDENSLSKLRDNIESLNESTKHSETGEIKQILLTVRGSILETNNDEGKRYIINTDSVPATLNGVIQYNGNPMTIDYNNSGIKVEGDGDLKLVGGMKFWKWGFEINLENEKDYSLNAISWEDISNIDPSNREAFINKNIEYLYVREPIHAQDNVKIKFTGIGQICKIIGGFLIQINDVILEDKAVSFGGNMALTFFPQEAKDDNPRDPLGLSAQVDKILYEQNEQGDVKFKGIDVTTEIGLPEDLIGGILENGAEATLTINTIDKVYSIEASMTIKTIECTGLLTVIFNDDNRPVLDDLEFSAAVPKIPVFPPSLYINRLGGGINDLYGTITGDVTAPPLKVILIAGIQLVSEDMFQGEVRISVSKLMLTITGEIELVPLSEIVMDARLEARWADPWYISLEAELNIIDILVGNIDIYISSSWFEGKATATLQLPSRVPIIGGKSFAEACLGVNSDKLWGSVYVKIWTPVTGTKKLGVGLAYYWDGGLKVSDNGRGTYVKKGLYEDLIILDSGKSIQMAVGTNIKKIGDSTDTIEYASLDEGIDLPALYATSDETQHFFNVYNQEIVVFQINYEGSQPENIILYRPNGVIYPLVSDEGEKAYLIKEGEEGQKNELYIFVPEPDNGTWKLVVDTPVQTEFLEMQAVPELDSVSASKNGETNVDVSWTTTNADKSVVNISLLEEGKEDAGILLVKDIDANLGNYTVDVPKSIMDGDYRIRVELKEGDYGYQVMESDAFYLTNPNSPSAVNNNINLELLGNGLMGIEFDNVNEEGVVGYYVEVFTPSGEKVEAAGEYFVDQGTTNVVIGGKYITDDVTDEFGNVITSGEELGLEPDNTYKVGITTLKQVDSTQLLSSTTYSNTIFLPQPNPATLTLNLDNNYLVGQDDEGKSINIINDSNAIIDFSSNQNVKTTVKVNDTVFTTFTGIDQKIVFPVDDGTYSVEVICENDNKDISSEVINFTVDNTPPVLLIESPEEGLQSAIDNVLVSGVSEPDAQVFINGAIVSTDEDGRFETVITLNDVLRKTILVEAKDQAQNVSSFETVILNAEADDIVEVFISPEVVNMRNGTTQRFSLIGSDASGNQITIENSMITWDIMNGSTIAEFSKDGLLTAYKTGEIVIVGSYYVSNDYAYEDAMTINIVDNDDLNGLVNVAINPKYTGLRVGRRTKLTLMGLDDKGDTITLDQKLVEWSISRGSSFATISDDGTLYAKRAGVITVKGIFSFTQQDVYEDTIEITIFEEVTDDNPMSDVTNKELLNILNNIIAREKDIIVLAMRNIATDIDNDISAGEELNLRIPTGAVNHEDAILIAKMKRDSQEEIQAKNQRLKNVTSLYEIQFAQSSRTLEKSVELKFKLDNQSVKNIENVGVYYFNEKYGKWEYIGGNVVGDEIKVNIDHFSKYAVFESEQALDLIDIDGIWSEDYIKKLASLDITNGIIKDGLMYYEPTRHITRLELAAMICRVMVAEELQGENPPFDDWSDIPEWGKAYVKIAYDNNWIKGKANGTSLLFLANDYATRAEVGTIVGRLIDSENLASIDFLDKEDIPLWAKGQVAKLIGEGIISGYPDGTFKPNSYITREEVAKILSTLIEKHNK